MAGTLTISTLSDGTNSTSSTNCIQGSAKAWVNLNGSGGATIRSSYNVSSVSRVSTGLYQINFTNAMSDTNYTVTNGISYDGATGSGLTVPKLANINTTYFQVCSYSTGASPALYDAAVVNCSVFR